MPVVGEITAKERIINNPSLYIDAFESLIPDGAPKNLWKLFTPPQKEFYIKWFFNESDPILGRTDKLNEVELLTFLESNGVTKDIFLARFPDNKYNPDKPNDVTAITAVNVYEQAMAKPTRYGGSRCRRQRTRKYKKSKRIFKSKNRQTTRR
ncbi:MAG: hypothetical protein EBU66_14645 [Bacteroidetes bacterium]|nr:hypothetical protein [bacterium]NBP65886.1 hypothetical protein [Bacteroidota bacterium]